MIVQDRMVRQGFWTVTNVVDVAMKVENKVDRSTMRPPY